MIKVLRYMEWERAKGSLRAILAAYTEAEHFDNFPELSNLVEDFIKDFGEKAGLD